VPLKKERKHKGIIIVPDTDALEGIEGEIKVGESSKKIEATLDGASRAIVTEDQVQTLTNKTIDADANVITNIEDENIKDGAAINAEKIADGSVSNEEFQYLDGVTAPIQGQIDSINDRGDFVTSTGLSTGGILSVNVDPTKFDLTAGTGTVVDYATDPTNPTITSVTWGAFTAQSVTGLAIQDATYILINSAGAILQQSNYPDASQRRANIFVGRLGHSNHTSVQFATSFPDLVQSPTSQLYDFMDALGSFNINGNELSDNGANFQFQKSAGNVFFRSFNYPTNDQQPHTSLVASATPATFFYRTQTALNSTPMISVDVTKYDVGGVVTTIPNATDAVIHRVFLAPNGVINIQYGQNLYANLSTALASIATDTFIVNPTIPDVTILIGYIVAQKNAPALNDVATVAIVQAGKFSAGASGGVNTVISLQQTYNSSNNPEIILDGTHGGLDIRDNSSPIGGSLFNIKNNDSSAVYLDVSASGSTMPNANLFVPTITGGTITTSAIVTPDRLDVKKDTKANLDFYALSASNGQIVFATDEDAMYQIIDGVLESLAGGTGDVVGPAGNFQDGGIPVFDGTTGKLLKDSDMYWDGSTFRANSVDFNIATTNYLMLDESLRERIGTDALSGTDVLLNPSAYTPIIILTSGSLVSIGAINITSNGANLTLFNRTGNTISFLNNSASHSANQRILTGTGGTITVANGQAIEFKYDSSLSMMAVIGKWDTVAASSGGISDTDIMFAQTFDSAVLGDFTQTGLALNTADTMHGAASAKLTHQGAINQSFAQTVAVNTKFRGVNMTASMLVRSTASEGNVTLTVTDVTNSATLTSQSIGTASQAVASLTTTNLSATVGGFTTANINLLSVGMSVTGSGIPAGTEITAISTSALTVTISNNATATATVTLRFSALPKTVQLGFSIPANCASIRYTITALPEAGSPETYIDDVVFKNYFLGMSNQGQSTLSVVVPNVTAWQSYTPTFTGFGTASSVEFEWRQLGEDVQIRGKFVSGTSTAVEARISLPNSYTSASTSVIPSIQNIGKGVRTAVAATFFGEITALIEPSVNYITFGIQSSTTDGLTKATGTGLIGSGQTLSFFSSVPVTGLTATSTQSFTSTDLVPAKAVLGNSTLTIPAVTDWVSYTPTMSHVFGGITNATASAKWRRDGSDVLVQGSVTFSAASALFAEIYLSLPNGYTIDSSKLSSVAALPTLGNTMVTDLGNNTYGPGIVRYDTSTRVQIDASQIATHTGAVPVMHGTLSNTFPITFGTGDAITFEFRFPAVGLSATSEVVVSGTQAALVQQPDSMVRLSGANGYGSTATTVRRFSTITQNVGSDILYVDSATLGGQFTAQVAGIYNVSYTEESNANTAVMYAQIVLNGARVAFDQQQYNTASAAFKSANSAWSGYLNVGDVITATVSTASDNNGANAYFTMSRAGSLKVASVSADQKIAIPTSELKFSGSSSRGTGDAGARVKFDAIANIRGDAFTVVNDVTGTSVTMTKAGILSASTTLFGSAASHIFLVKNGLGLAVDRLSGASAYGTAAWTGSVQVGDVIVVQADAAPAVSINNQLNLSFQEQSVQVSVSNTLPQFSESDTSLRLSGANGFGSTATTTRRFASVLQNLGNDIEYTDSATLGGQFRARVSGIYNIAYSEVSTANTINTSAVILLNGTQIANDNQTYNTATTAGKSASVSWQGYLTAGDIITAIVASAAENNGSQVLFTMSKVGKPNVTGVNVTPFIQIPQPLVQSSFLNSAATIGAATITGALQSNTNNGIYSYNATTGIYTMLKRAEVKISASARTAGAATVQLLGVLNGGVFFVANSPAISQQWVTASGTAVMEAGSTFYVTNNVANNTDAQNISVSATANPDQILTAPETFSTDTAPLVYAGSGSYTLSTLNTAPVGTFITFTYAINTNTRTQTTTAPTQTTSDMNANGVLLYARAYNAASTAAQPSTIAIQIGKGLKGVSQNFYKSTGKATSGNLDLAILDANATQIGAQYKDYNEVTGILFIDVGVTVTTAVTLHTFLFSDVTAQTNGYLTVNASKNPALTGMGIPTIAARGVSSSGQSIPNATNTILTYDTAKTYDNTGSLNAATGIFTAPETGYYQINASILYNGAAWAAGVSRSILIYKNGIEVTSRFVVVEAAINASLTANIGDVVFLYKNDTASIGLAHSRGTATTLFTTGSHNYFSIQKVNF
jgi:hypothetical protein